MKVIITGASRGIGKGIALVLADKGHTVGLLARSEDGLLGVEREIVSQGGRCATAPCNLRSWERTEEAVLTLIMAMGGIDALINNAGHVIRKDIFSISLEEWHTLMETNINGVFYATRAVLPHLRKQQHGHIINISSISGRLPLAGGSGYAASKYAVTGFSESLFEEVRDMGIKVSTVFPGSVDTQSHQEDEQDSPWKIAPAEVGVVCAQLLDTAPGNCLSRVEIRPLKRPARHRENAGKC